MCPIIVQVTLAPKYLHKDYSTCYVSAWTLNVITISQVIQNQVLQLQGPGFDPKPKALSRMGVMH